MATVDPVQIPQLADLKQSPYRYLFEDTDFARWYSNRKRRSVATAQEWIRRFGLIHKKFAKLPADFAKMDAKEAGNFLLDMVSTLEAEGKSGSYISNCVKPLKNWLAFNGVYMKAKIEIANRHKLTTVANERVPTTNEVGTIIGAGDYRSKTMCSLMALAGLRNEVMGNSIGTDGLRIKDLPEMRYNNEKNTIEFTKIPTIIIIREELSKAKHQYFTFLAGEGCDYLKRWLEERMENGEVLNADSPIVTQTKLQPNGKHNRVVKFGFLRTSNLSEFIKIPIVKAGYSWRPYVLRRYSETRTMLAENDGIMIHEWRQFFHGHKGDMESTYTVEKGLSPDVIEKMRESYLKASEKYLVITSGRNGATQDMVRAEMYRTVLEMAHFTSEEVDHLGDLSKLSSADISKKLEDKQKANLGLKNGGSQKIITEVELEGYINDGWEHVKDLPGSKCIVKLPNSN